jgi:hypothetical protein
MTDGSREAAMHREVSARRRRRRRHDPRAPYVVGVLLYAGGLALLNVWPTWEAMPFLTDGAATAMALLNVTLITGLVSQAIYVVDSNARMRAAASYGMGLLNMVVLGLLWRDFPFDFGTWGPEWAQATRLLIAVLFVWAAYVALRSTVGVVRGRRPPRLAPSHA